MPTDSTHLYNLLHHHHEWTTNGRSEKAETGQLLMYLQSLIFDEEGSSPLTDLIKPATCEAVIIPYAMLEQQNEHPNVANSVIALAMPVGDIFTFPSGFFDPADENTLATALDQVLELQGLKVQNIKTPDNVLNRPVQLAAVSFQREADEDGAPKNACLVFACELKTINKLQAVAELNENLKIINMRHDIRASPSAHVPQALFRAAFRLVSEANPPKC